MLAALRARRNALTFVVIPPGEQWSFNAAIGDPRTLRLNDVNGVIGGGWCDLASRYVQAVRPLLANDDVRFVNHVASNGVAIKGVEPQDAASIWNIDGRPGFDDGRKDVIIANHGTDTIILTTVIDHRRGSASVIAFAVPPSPPIRDDCAPRRNDADAPC